jgi:hypothetical protein
MWTQPNSEYKKEDMTISNRNNKKKKSCCSLRPRNILSKEKEGNKNLLPPKKSSSLFFFWLDNFCPCQGGKVEEKKRKDRDMVKKKGRERVSSRRKYLGIIDTLHRSCSSSSSRSS